MPITDPDGTIPLPVAKEWAENWRTFISTNSPEFITRSFMIPIFDFQNILLYNPTAESVKAFIGLTDPTDATTAQLMLVPIVDGEEVHLLPLVGGGLGDTQSNVYDMTTACPPTCITSPGDTLDS
ncbi:hypothetical protein EWM62_08815 [Mucilaginibacter terrigena]|uniref:Uncharacterized protein n=1 Tax=Mucilaginibacter terrigena TaxID=2492395 RepID=A0A4Q5LM48_9SPHI|nr:hypothetical protein [Mucilaginibacter terrigena]RYU90736.1 hypothetical protein EWM62_08815 [Mucilaginibacter terrigena]